MKVGVAAVDHVENADEFQSHACDRMSWRGVGTNRGGSSSNLLVRDPRRHFGFAVELDLSAVRAAAALLPWMNWRRRSLSGCNIDFSVTLNNQLSYFSS